MKAAACSVGSGIALLAASLALVVAATAPAGAQDSGGDTVLRIGWGQDPQTLNPFFGVDEEDYTIWALTWDLLIGYNPEDLTPVAGIAESWEVSEDKKTVTFELADRNWSDGEPITSADVKYSLETLGEEGLLFAGYTSNVTSIETPDDKTVVIETKRPDARIVGGLFVYILPEHIWGEVSIEELNSSYKPDIPMVGSGPYIVTEFERGRILTMEVNPEWNGDTPGFDRIEFVKYGTEDAVERALQLGEIDVDLEVQPATFEQLGEEPNIDTIRSSSPSYTELAFNLCSEENCPDAQFNPAVQDLTVRQAIGYAVDRVRVNEISALGTSFPGEGILPSFYKAFFETPEMNYTPPDVDLANQMLDDADWVRGDDGVRTRDGQRLEFDLLVRASSQSDIQAARLVQEMTEPIGVQFNVQVVSVDKLTEVTIRKVDGVPAPEFDTFIWGWGGDPYDPSFLLSLLTTDEIGATSDSFYSNPEYDRLFEQQVGEFDTAVRRELIAQMVALTQEDLPYLVLTFDPNLQAYRTDRIANVEQVCPADETGDLMCEQVTYAGLLSLEPAGGGSGSSVDDGSSWVLIVLAVVFGAAGGYTVGRRRRADTEPLELPE